MKVTDLQTLQIDMPFKQPYKSAMTLAFVKKRRHLFVRLDTDEGITGFGEASSDPLYSGETMQTALEIIRQKLAGCVIGEDPFNLNRIIQRMDRAIRPGSNNYAKFAIETALYDLMGKAAGLPVFKLLGGNYRDAVPCHKVISIVEPGKAAEEAADAIKQGYRAITVKAGLHPEEDVESVKRVREAVGSKVQLAVDVNQGYSRQTAIRTIRRLEKYELEFIEQPVAYWDLNGMALLSQIFDIPIAADESLVSVHDALRIVQDKVADVFVLELAKHGGIYNSWKIAQIAEAENLPCRVGGSAELEVGTCAGIHLTSAIKEIVPFTGYQASINYVASVVKRDLCFQDGAWIVPSEPGLGVELDEDKVNRFRVKESDLE